MQPIEALGLFVFELNASFILYILHICLFCRKELAFQDHCTIYVRFVSFAISLHLCPSLFTESSSFSILLSLGVIVSGTCALGCM